MAPSCLPEAKIALGVITGIITSLPSATAIVNKVLGIPFAAPPPERFSPLTYPQAWARFVKDPMDGPGRNVLVTFADTDLAVLGTNGSSGVTRVQECDIESRCGVFTPFYIAVGAYVYVFCQKVLFFVTLSFEFMLGVIGESC